MRISIFSHGTNPATDKPLLRKKLPYIQSLIAERRAFPLDRANIYAGVQLRGRLPAQMDAIERVVGSGFDTAWRIKQSGSADPIAVNGELVFGGQFVWQLRTQRVYV